jgi:hypothetical protein
LQSIDLFAGVEVDGETEPQIQWQIIIQVVIKDWGSLFSHLFMSSVVLSLPCSILEMTSLGRETSQQLRAFTVSFMRSIVAVVDEFSSFLSFFKF